MMKKIFIILAFSIIGYGCDNKNNNRVNDENRLSSETADGNGNAGTNNAAFDQTMLDAVEVPDTSTTTANERKKYREIDHLLLIAVRINDLAEVKRLIAQGANVNVIPPYTKFYAPLFFARSVEMAKLLIESGADVNIKNKYSGATPLHWARNVNIARLLLDKGANSNARNNWGETALFSAGTVEMARLLLDKGADPNARNNDGKTPLHQERIVAIIQLLIAKGADTKAKDQYGNTPLHTADNVAVARVLIQHETVWTLNEEVPGEPEPVASASKYVNTKNEQGNTALHFVRSVEMARLLIESGADVNAVNNEGATPLDEIACNFTQRSPSTSSTNSSSNHDHDKESQYTNLIAFLKSKEAKKEGKGCKYVSM